MKVYISDNRVQITEDGDQTVRYLDERDMLTLFFNEKPARRFSYATENRLAVFSNVEALELE